MRFRYGSIPEDDEFHPEAQSWSDLREPGPLIINLLAIPTAILLLAATGYAISLAWPGGILGIIQKVLEQSSMNPFLVSLVVIVISIPVHELVHLLVHPKFGRSDKSILGLWLSRGMFYAHYEGAVSRNRFLSILAAPYLVLAWLPVIVIAIFGTSVPIEYVVILVLVALVNCALPAGDILGIFLLVSQVPSSACEKNKGWKSYWKQGIPCEE
jgi:hypothetical protein